MEAITNPQGQAVTFVCGERCDDEPLLHVVVLPDGRVWGRASPNLRTGTRNRADNLGYIPEPGDLPPSRREEFRRPPEQLGRTGADVLTCRRCRRVRGVRISRARLDAAAVDAARRGCTRVEVMSGGQLMPMGSGKQPHPDHPFFHLGPKRPPKDRTPF
jgi:hypothetical protein